MADSCACRFAIRPAVRTVDTTEPAEVPTTRSAAPRSTPAPMTDFR